MSLQGEPSKKPNVHDADTVPGPAQIAPRRLVENIFSLYILQGLNYIVPMAVLPYLVRVLGMEMYGLIAWAQSFAQYFSLLTDYGFNYSATRSIAQQSGNREGISRIFCAVMLIKSLLTVLGAIILVAIVLSVPRLHESSAFFFVAYFAVIGGVLFPTWYFQGIEQMRFISGIIGLSRLLGAAALFVFVHHPSDALTALAIQSLSLVLGGAAGLWVAFKKLGLRFYTPTTDELIDTLRGGWNLFVTTAAVSLYTNTNVFLVGLLAGNLQAGYFSAAEKIIRAMQGLLNPISQALFPRMSSLATQSRHVALHFALRVLRWIGGLAFAASIAIFVLAGPIAVICFGGGASGSIPIIRWISFLPFVIAVSNVFAVQMMIPFGLDKPLSKIVVLAGLFNVAMAIPLIRIFAATGAGISVLITESFVTVVTGLFIWRYSNQAETP